MKKDKGKSEESEQLQRIATDHYLENEGSKMIINQEILKKAQHVAREEAIKEGQNSPIEQKK